jgi:hypothetical protein
MLMDLLHVLAVLIALAGTAVNSFGVSLKWKIWALALWTASNFFLLLWEMYIHDAWMGALFGVQLLFSLAGLGHHLVKAREWGLYP